MKYLIFFILIFPSLILSNTNYLPVLKLYNTSKSMQILYNSNGQIVPESLPSNVAIIDINNDNYLDAFIFHQNKLELHYGVISGFSRVENGFWEFDQPIKRIIGDYDKKFMQHRLNIEFENGERDYLRQWANKIITRKDYETYPDKYQVEIEIPHTIQVNNGFQMVWENQNLGYHLYNVLTGDLDRDGKQELILSTWPVLWGALDVLHIYENVSDNTYQEVFTYQDTIYDFGVMEITDLDADGKLELCVFSGGGPPGWTLDPYLILFENTGDNSFNRQMIPAYVNLNDIHPSCARWADSDLNGKPELIIGFDRDNLSTHYTYIEFYENINPNTFDLLQWWLRIQQLPVHGVAVGDLDNDGWGDVYVGMAASTIVHRWEYYGYQSFQQKWFDTINKYPIYPETFDYDGNNIPELIFIGGYWDLYPGREAIIYLRSESNDTLTVIAFDTTSFYHGTAPLWGNGWKVINNEYYLSASSEICPDSGQYFDGYAVLFKRNPNFQYPFEPIFYSPVVDSTAIHHALATDLDDDSKVELITGKQFHPARVRIWEEDAVVININPTPVNRDLSLQAFPNPFNSSTVINFRLSKAGNTDLIIYDILGQPVSQPLKQNYYPAGQHHVTLNDKNLKLDSSGIYLVQLKTPLETETIKLMFIK